MCVCVCTRVCVDIRAHAFGRTIAWIGFHAKPSLYKFYILKFPVDIGLPLENVKTILVYLSLCQLKTKMMS